MLREDGGAQVHLQRHGGFYQPPLMNSARVQSEPWCQFPNYKLCKTRGP